MVVDVVEEEVVQEEKGRLVDEVEGRREEEEHGVDLEDVAVVGEEACVGLLPLEEAVALYVVEVAGGFKLV